MTTTNDFRSMFRCPSCGAFAAEGPRYCALCGYWGDWIQPGHEHLYKCPEYDCIDLAEEPIHYGQYDCKCATLAKTHGLAVVHSDICAKDRAFHKNLAEGPIWIEPRTFRQVAFHEASHAVAAAAVGFEVHSIVVENDPEDSDLVRGRTSFVGPPTVPFTVPPDVLDDRLTVALAGQAGEEILSGKSFCPCGHETGSVPDMVAAEQTAACAESHSNQNILQALLFGASALSKEDLETATGFVEKRKNRLFGVALDTLRKHWSTVEKLAARIEVAGGKLEKPELEKLLAEVRS